MEFKIYENYKEEPKIYFRLVNTSCKGIKLVAVNEYGSEIVGGDILTINEKGLFLHVGISDAIKLPLDNRGGIKLKA